jgi:hypothetical protein
MTSASSTSSRSLLVGRWLGSREAWRVAVPGAWSPRVSNRDVWSSRPVNTALAVGLLEVAGPEPSFPGPFSPSCESASSASSRVAIARDGSHEVLDPSRLRPASLPGPPATRRRTVVRRSVRRARRRCRPAGGFFPSDPRDEDPLSEHCRDRMGSGFPAPALLWFPGRRSSAGRRPLQGLVPRPRCLRGPGGPPAALLGFLPSRVLSSAGLASVCSPEPSSYALSAPLPVGLRCPAPWSLA